MNKQDTYVIRERTEYAGGGGALNSRERERNMGGALNRSDFKDMNYIVYQSDHRYHSFVYNEGLHTD